MDYEFEKNMFQMYADRYDRANGMIELKIIHTLRVCEVMDRITASLGLPEEIRYLASVCALFHDIGRFEQVRRYGTLNDRISVDHAALSCEVLQKEGFLDHLTKEQRKMVLAAVANHNRLAIEEGLGGDTLLLAKLIRDADKVDIFRVFAEEEMVDTMGETISQVAQEKITDHVYDCFMAHKCVPRGIRRSGLDIWVGFLGFFYDMNFPESIRMAVQEGFYKRPFLEADFSDEETRRRVDTILREIEIYLISRQQ